MWHTLILDHEPFLEDESYRPSGTNPFFCPSLAINCQATFILSLRDKACFAVESDMYLGYHKSPLRGQCLADKIRFRSHSPQLIHSR